MDKLVELPKDSVVITTGASLIWDGKQWILNQFFGETFEKYTLDPITIVDGIPFVKSEED